MKLSDRRVKWGIGILAGLTVLAIAALVSLNPAGDGSTSATTATSQPATSDPMPVAEAFLAAWSEAQWSDLTPLTDATTSGNELADWWLDAEVQSVNIEILDSVPALDGVEVTYEVAAELSGGILWRYQSQLVVEDAGPTPLVQWSPAVIHPSLQQDDRVRLVRTWLDRAPILDVSGEPLVAPDRAISVGVIPGRIRDRDEIKAAFAEHTTVGAAAIDQALDASGVQPDWFLPLTEVPAEDYADIRPVLYPVPGIAFRVDTERTARNGLAASLIGTTGEITAELLEELGAPYAAGLTVGRSGLERAHETTLAGSPQVEIVRVDGTGSRVEVLETFPAESPQPLTTTLDVHVQRSAQEALSALEIPAALVALDPETGEIRAAASTPDDGFSRAVSALYPPGSSFKIVTAYAALESGMTPDTQVECPESITVSGRQFGNADKLPATLTLADAFAVSCNTAFIGIAKELDTRLLQNSADAFGFNTDYDPGAPSAGGSYPRPDDDAELAASSIGQGRVLVSPLHMASIAASVARGGWQPPSLVAGDDRTLTPLSPGITTQLAQMMRDTVIGGTATAANVEGIPVSGKTGTAQIGSGDDLDTVAWFVGFTDDLAFAVAVEGGESGGGAAAPVAAQFLRATQVAPSAAGCIDPKAGWPMFQGSGARLGCALGTASRDAGIDWTADVGIMAWLNTPVISGTTALVGTAGSLRGARDDLDGVVAINTRNGRERWRFATKGDVNGVAVADELVVATGDEGAVWALDVATGKQVWKYRAPGPVFSHPLVVRDLVVVGDNSGWLRALELSDGSERWSHQLAGPVRGGAATDGKVIFAAGELGVVRAFTLDGFEMWSRELQHPTDGSLVPRVLSPPTVADDLVIFSVLLEGRFDDPALVALDRFVGSVVWWGSGSDPQSGANVRGSSAASGSTLVAAPSVSRGIEIVGTASGAARSSTFEGPRCTTQWGSPVVAGDTALVGRADGVLHAYDPATGSERWAVALNREFIPVTAGDCSQGGARVKAGPPIQSTPAIAPDGTIVIGSMGGVLYGIAPG